MSERTSEQSVLDGGPAALGGAPNTGRRYAERVYCDGHITKQQLAAKLDRGLVCTDVVRNGYSGGDMAYFRDGTPEEIEQCRALMATAAAKRGGK